MPTWNGKDSTIVSANLENLKIVFQGEVEQWKKLSGTNEKNDAFYFMSQ